MGFFSKYAKNMVPQILYQFTDFRNGSWPPQTNLKASFKKLEAVSRKLSQHFTIARVPTTLRFGNCQ